MAGAGLERAPRLADVAEAAGVSKGTASNVFNRPELVRAEVRERVEAAARAIGYRGPDPRGRMLSAGRAGAIGVVTGEPLSYFFEDAFAREMMGGITEACDAAGIGISLVSAANEAGMAWNVGNALVDGFIVFCLERAEKLLALSQARGLPYVALALGKEDAGLSVVAIDNVAAARRAAEHLCALGHRRFAVLAMELSEGGAGPVTAEALAAAKFSTTADRLAGYFAALAAHGVDTARVPAFETQSDAATVAAALEAVFAAPERPTAILAQSDRIALLALDWLTARGISVPGEVSVVGFDGVAAAARSDPPLTTIAQPIAEIGRRAVAAILERGHEVWRELLPVELVVRGSTAPPPG
jgi:DNA-binding LacI/PurR family transcriptional regulator